MPKSSGLDVVEIDNFEAGYRMVRHILERVKRERMRTPTPTSVDI